MKDKKKSLILLGQKCKSFRESIKETQFSVAVDTDYSMETISGFENGRNNNLSIFLWYLNAGMEIAQFSGILRDVFDYDY